MARAGVASASAHPDSIKGLAQSIAKPAYRRLLTAEPLLRRAVPVLIIAFLATICVGAVVQVLDQRRQTLNTMALSLEAVADLAAERLQQPLKQTGDAVERPQRCWRALPPWATGSTPLPVDQCGGRGGGRVAATDATIGRRLIDLPSTHSAPSAPAPAFSKSRARQTRRWRPCACSTPRSARSRWCKRVAPRSLPGARSPP